MFRTSRLFGTACAFLVSFASLARADQLGWQFEASGTPVIEADNHGGVTFAYDPAGQAVGDTNVVLANLWTYSQADPTKPDAIGGAGYTLSLNITDAQSGKSGTVDLHGELSGLVSSKSAIVMTTPTSPTVQKLALGQNLYTVMLAGYSPPGPPQSSNSGAISALVMCQPNTVPEPAGLVLAGLGVAGLGLGAWRKRRLAKV
jgi:hypothetical protein